MTALEKALIEVDRPGFGGRILRDPEVLNSFAQDASEEAPCQPGAVIRVSTAEQVSRVLKAATAHHIPVTARSGGTSRVGGSVPSPNGIVLSFDKMNQIKGVESGDMLAVVEPGVITGDLHRIVETDGLFYPPDPNSLDSCCIGGNIAANAGGPRTFKYGVTGEYVLGMQVVTADGTILNLGRRTSKGVTGYDLTSLMIGSEGTLGIVTEATLKLIPKPSELVTLLVFLPDHETIARSIQTALSRRLAPRCVELVDALALDILRPQAGLPIPTEAQAMLLIELDGGGRELEEAMENCGQAMLDAGAIEVLVAQSGSERQRLWAARRELSYSLRKAAGNKLSEDVVVPRSQIAMLLEQCRRLAGQEEIRMPTYGHAGDGNLHVNFLWDDPSEREGVDRAIRALFEDVVSRGGTLSGEHGIGTLKAPYLDIEQSPELIALQRRIKALFDPADILNPGKIFTPGGPTRHGSC